ncbi:ATP synthase peripheral stalk subunit F6, mitochondrial isoform 2-T2 [Geothlypis trichas]
MGPRSRRERNGNKTRAGPRSPAAAATVRPSVRSPARRTNTSRRPSASGNSPSSGSAIMILRQILRLSSLFHSAVSVHLRRNIGLSAIVFNKAKELDPVQKLFVDKIREYNTKSKQAGGPVDAGPEFQKDMNESLARLQRAYGEGDLTKFPEFKFEEPKFEETPK